MQHLLLVGILLHVVATSTHATVFYPHHYDTELNVYRGPQTDWENDLKPALTHGDFGIIVHGITGSGVSRLVETLTGLETNSISGMSPSMSTGLTQEMAVYTKHSDNGGGRLYVMDTVGFGLQSEIQKQAALDSVDAVRQFAAHGTVPIKRIYFLVDCDKCNDTIPKKIAQNLAVLEAVYGAEVVHQVRFVISKCDSLATRYTKSDYIEFRQKLADRYREAIDMASDDDVSPTAQFDQNRVLFISAKNGDMRQLTDDLAAAAHDSDLNFQGDLLGNVLGELKEDIQEIKADLVKKMPILVALEKSQTRQVFANLGVELMGVFFFQYGAAIKGYGEISKLVYKKVKANNPVKWAARNQQRQLQVMHPCDEKSLRAMVLHVQELKTIVADLEFRHEIWLKMTE